MESKKSTQKSIILNHGFERLITDGVRAFTVENLGKYIESPILIYLEISKFINSCKSVCKNMLEHSKG